MMDLNPNDQLSRIPSAEAKDQEDDRIARWGRSQHEGYRKFKHGFIQPAPLLFTQDHHPLWLGDIYRGRSVFLIAGGPSFGDLNHALLHQPGILTMGLNNSAKTFRPNLWACVDPPEHFIRSIWLDTTIQKFVPICHASKFIFNSDQWRFMDIRVGDCPNVVYFKRNEHFRAKQYLWEDCINWGNHKQYGGGRSVMLAAVRILFILGIRQVYLLGVDFKMSATDKYHFEQDRHRGSISSNRSTYGKLNNWFAELRPHFEQENFNVYNCNPDSGLRAFDYLPFPTAIQNALVEFDCVDVKAERTRGLYDVKHDDKLKGIGK
jgi:hypothetical protein